MSHYDARFTHALLMAIVVLIIHNRGYSLPFEVFYDFLILTGAAVWTLFVCSYDRHLERKHGSKNSEQQS